MFDRVIVAFGDAPTLMKWRTVAAGMLGPALWPGVKVEKYGDAAGVRQARRGVGGKDLVILGRSLPADRDDQDAPAGPLGAAMDIAGELQREASPPACVLIGPANNQISKASAAWPLFETMDEAASSEADDAGVLGGIVTGLAARRDNPLGQKAPASAPAKPWALIDVRLIGDGSSCRLRIGQGNRSGQPDEFPLDLDANMLALVLEESRTLRLRISQKLGNKQSWQGYVGQWQRDYEALGRRIFDLIGRTKFQTLWGMAVQAANENVRVRFVLNEAMYDGLWEAMYDPDEKWMMLRSTIARQARSSIGSNMHRLDGGDGTVHVLAIGSDVPAGSTARGPANAGWTDFWNTFHLPFAEDFQREKKRDPQLNDMFQPLKEIAAEMEVLRTLKDAVNGRRADKMDLKILDGPADGLSLLQQVKRQLLAGPRVGGAARFDVVHFAGHALFNDKGGPHDRGYLVFGGNPETDFVPVSTFALWLKQAGVQMVYLSCCRSSAARAAFELAHVGIPLAIGFTWDLDSTLAVQFAQAFYEELFNNDLKICRAFQSARQTLAAEHQASDPIWASPVLMAQPDDWPSVEGYMMAAS